MADNPAQIDLTADSSQFDAEMKRAAELMQSQMQKMQSSVRESMQQIEAHAAKMQSSMKSNFESITAAISKVSGAFAAIGVAMSVQHVVEVASTFEQLEIRLNSVMGSAQAGAQAFDWIKQFAQNTPYSVQQTTDAFMTLKNFGLDPMDGTLQKVADASAKYGSSAETAQRVSLALGQAWARGKLQGQDTLQMIDAGIPVYDLLSKATGKTAAEIQKMSEAGTMGRDIMKKLIDQMGAEGAGTAAAKMKSYAGEVSNMGDAFENSIDKLRKQGGFDFLKQSVHGFTELIPGIVATVGEAFAAIGDIVKTAGEIIADVMRGISSIIDSVFGTSSQPMSALETFGYLIKGINVVVIAFRATFQESFEFIKMLLAETVAQMVNFSLAAARALKLDFAGAKAAWQSGMDESRMIVEQGMQNMVKIAQKGREDMDRAIFGEQKKPVPDNDPGNGKTPGANDAKKGGQSQMSRFEEELAEKKIQYQKDNELREMDLARERAWWAEKLQMHGLSQQDKLAISRKISQLELEELKKAHKDKLQLSQMEAEEQQRIELHGLDLKRQQITLARQMGDISAQDELQALRDLEDQKYQVELKAAEDRAALVKDEPVQYQQAMDKIAQIKRQHDLEMQKNSAALALEQKKEFDQMFTPITSAFEKSVTGMIQGTLTLQKAMQQMAQSIAMEFANMGVKLVVDWARNELFKTQATAAGAATRGTIESGAAAQSTALSAGSAVKGILNAAAETMANVYNALAGIPVVGPAIAPAAAATAGATVSGFAGSVMSASGGYDIPAGVNPMTQLHQQEMVLPAHIANPLRDMIAQQGGGASGGHTINISAMDSRDVVRALQDGGALQRALTDLNRNFVRV